jgi:hypothetical protein
MQRDFRAFNRTKMNRAAKMRLQVRVKIAWGSRTRALQGEFRQHGHKVALGHKQRKIWKPTRQEALWYH